jgi:hypothetical protein
MTFIESQPCAPQVAKRDDLWLAGKSKRGPKRRGKRSKILCAGNQTWKARRQNMRRT